MEEAQIAEIATLPEMEWRKTALRVMANLQRQGDENTEMTADSQQTLNRDIKPKVDEMYEAWVVARDGLAAIAQVGRFLARIGRWLAWWIERAGRIAKPLLYIIAAVGGVWTFVKTGSFQMPAWFEHLFP